ncbi:MAG TPA: tetratricopeptide repeat protein [Bryobacteraceae bacterium]|nr:tetratricopeptide repeat protein [Bryobacteraceae bacterium]
MRARLLLLAAALLAFGASLGSGFHFDDYAIFSNPALTSPDGVLDIWGLRSTRPLTYFTFWLNFLAGGRNPLGYHLLNLALHLGAVLLAWECLRRLLPERAALLAAALFAVHPMQAEAVNYVWARSIVLAALLCFAALLAWLDGRRWEAVAWFALALLAKEECAAFPLVLWLVGRVAKSERKRAMAPILTMLGLALAAGARVVYATAVTPGAPAGLQAGITPWRYLLAQGPVLLRYLRLLIIPYGFTLDPDIRAPSIWLGLLAWAVVAALCVAAWRWRNLWFLAGLVLLLPSSSIFPAADLAADRRMYLPMLAFAAAAAVLLERVKPYALSAGIVIVLALVSVSRTVVWRNDASLWREAVRLAPEKTRPRIWLARALPAGQALEVLAQAREQAPNDPAIAAEIGKTLLSEGQPDGALTEFGRALALDPGNALYLNNRGVALEELGQTEAARADFERALRIDPDLTAARDNLQKLTAR